MLATRLLLRRGFSTGLTPPKVQRVDRPRFNRGVLATRRPAALESAASAEDVDSFAARFPGLVEDLTGAGRHDDAPSATRRLAKLLRRCVPTGKKNRGLALVLSHRLLTDDNAPSALNDTDKDKVKVMGWCVEMLHASMLMTQDLVDGARTRRGEPCWFQDPELQLASSNDPALLRSALYQLLRLHFQAEPYYPDVLQLFHDVTHKANLGQLLDLEARADKTLDLFTMDRYQLITKYKVAYHTFQMPVALALHMAGIRDPEIHRQAKTILMEMGQFYQVLADFVDCYGPDQDSCDDIAAGRCTWLAVVALQRASRAQRTLLRECYGSQDAAKVRRVRELYDDLALASTFRVYSEQGHQLLCKQIQQTSRGLPHKLFFKFLDKIYVTDP